jgi:hypothetical protein
VKGGSPPINRGSRQRETVSDGRDQKQQGFPLRGQPGRVNGLQLESMNNFRGQQSGISLKYEFATENCRNRLSL